jgi:hypothetical protein
MDVGDGLRVADKRPSPNCFSIRTSGWDGRAAARKPTWRSRCPPFAANIAAQSMAVFADQPKPTTPTHIHRSAGACTAGALPASPRFRRPGPRVAIGREGMPGGKTGRRSGRWSCTLARRFENTGDEKSQRLKFLGCRRGLREEAVGSFFGSSGGPPVSFARRARWRASDARSCDATTRNEAISG